jgi:restriction endonuclease S subunit
MAEAAVAPQIKPSYEAPLDWRPVRLGSLLQESSKRPGKAAPESSSIPVLSITRRQGLMLQSSKFEKRIAGRDISNYKIVTRGQIVCGFPMDEGVVDDLKHQPLGIVSPAYTVWTVNNDEVESSFLSQLLRMPFMCQLYVGLSSRTVHRRRLIKRADFLDIAVSLPPLPEQRRIARVLNTIQKAIVAQEKVISAARELKRSLMRHLFTYGPVRVTDAARMPLKETEIGPVPDHWRVLALGDFAKLTSGGTPARSEPRYWIGDVPWVKTGEIDYNTINSAEEMISDEALRCSSAKLVPKGTLLAAMYGYGVTRGRVAILGVDAAINQACAAVFPDASVRTEFLFFAFSYAYERIRTFAHGAHQPNLSLTLLRRIPFGLPSTAEQEAIAKTLLASDRKLASEQERKRKLDTVFDSALHHLMTGKLRVPESLEA